MKVSRTILAAGIVVTQVPAKAQVPDTRPNVGRSIIVTGERSTLTVPNTEEATAAIDRTPGGVAIVSDTLFKNGPPQHLKDLLNYVPGVITQYRQGFDARVSIRGSGLSRAYGARGISFYFDGIPMNTSDGLLDFFEIDPSAYRYVEVHRGASALRYGSNALGGAINMVTPSGYDAAPLDARVDVGSFGYLNGQVSSGGVAGALDYFATVSAQQQDGYREHNETDGVRGNLNVGYRIAPDVETRFYLSGAITNLRIPGEVTKEQALNSPRSANPVWLLQNQQRNVDSFRAANKTSLRFGNTRVELGGFYNWRHVDHPIFQYLDYTVDDYGGFVRAVDERTLGGLRNRLILGANLHNGKLDTEQFVNLPGAVKGPLASSYVDSSENLSFYAEDSLYVTPAVALIAGVQFLHATRERRDRFLSNGDQSGDNSYDLWSPRVGVLWDVNSDWQLFANISRSAEVPTYDTQSFSSPANSGFRAQRATTYEIGTRGRRGGIGWDLALYRSEIDDELQCLTPANGNRCTNINADSTVHQGIEAGLDTSFPVSAITSGDNLALIAAYTYSDFVFDDDAVYGDNRLPGVPEHFLRAELLYKHPRGFYAGPNLEWSPESYFADNANSLGVDPYALLGLRAGYDTASGISAYVEGRNLTGKRYISTVAIGGAVTPAAEIFNPGTGRAIYAGLRARF